MLPASIAYDAPATIADAIAALAADPDSVVIGASPRTVIDLKMRRTSPPRLVDLRRITALRGIATGGEAVRVGSMTTLRTIMDDPGIRSDHAVLGEAAAFSGDPQMRNMETLLGCVTRDLATSGVAAALLALDATVHLAGPRGERSISMSELVARTPAVAPDHGEILSAVTLPPPKGMSAYAQVTHPATLDPVCGVAVCVAFGTDGTVERCSFAVAGATDRPTRLAAAEALVRGRPLTIETIRTAAASAAAALEMTSDPFASAEYRAQLITVLLGRTLDSFASGLPHA